MYKFTKVACVIFSCLMLILNPNSLFTNIYKLFYRKRFAYKFDNKAL